MSIIVLTALANEARPLIDYYQLRRQTEHELFAVYRSAEKPLTLLVTGVGLVCASAGCCYALDHFRPHLLVNFGSAGFVPSKAQQGTCYKVHTLDSPIFNQPLFLDLLTKHPWKEASLTTLLQPQDQEEGLATDLVDMEAAAIAQIAQYRLKLHQLMIYKLALDPLDPTLDVKTLWLKLCTPTLLKQFDQEIFSYLDFLQNQPHQLPLEVLEKIEKIILKNSWSIHKKREILRQASLCWAHSKEPFQLSLMLQKYHDEIRQETPSKQRYQELIKKLTPPSFLSHLS